MAFVAADANGAFKDLATLIQQLANYHSGLPTAVCHARLTTAANATAAATDATTLVTLANGLRTTMIAHFAAVLSASVGTGDHLAADATAIPAAATGTFDVLGLLNAMWDILAMHRESRACHIVPDTTSSPMPSSATGGDVTSMCASANALKTALNAHMARAASSTAAA